MRKYPFADMEVGDGIYVAAADRHKVANAAHMSGKRHGRRFSVERQADGRYLLYRKPDASEDDAQVYEIVRAVK